MSKTKNKIKHNCKRCAELSNGYTELSKEHEELSKEYEEKSKEFAEKCRCEE